MTNKERQKRYRERQKALRAGGIVTESVTEGITASPSVTDTDVMFEKAKPGYYIFEYGEPWERKCWKCGTAYSTRLELNKFCSPTCKDEFLAEASRSRFTESSR